MSARLITDPNNPGIASLIFRSGLAEYVQRKYGRNNRRLADQRRAARTLRESGIIDYDQYVELRRKIDRRAVASTLRHLRRQEPFAIRSAVIAKLRKAAPMGVSARDFRMGLHAQA